MKKTFLFFAFLFLLSCLGQISSDLYLPALPVIQEALKTTAHLMQVSIAIFMLGFALSHLVYGPISDAIGRKNPVIVGLSICLIGTTLCYFSRGIDLFLTGRLLQGIGAGSGAALFLSMLRDVYEGNELAKISSFLAISRVILLASAPLIGAYLLHFFSWQACFIFLLIYASICMIGILFIYRETNQYQQQQTLRILNIARNMKRLLTNANFMSFAFCVMLAFGGILAWLTTLPFLLQEVVGLTAVQFGWVAAIAGLFFIVGGLINALLVEKVGIKKMLVIGLCIMLAGSIVMLIFGLLHHESTWAIMIPVVIYIVGCSMIFSNAYAGAMHGFPTMAGTAGALFGFLQILGGSISSYLMSLTKTYNQIPLSIALLLSAILALITIPYVSMQTETA
ncbi:MAG: hypothetical protein A3I77_06220 [Gammaproteobacteria bacterium RIFCSPLOWO2_02_FULL_42_14]|nr:MAG: hypothetical protein A3B71_06815 [Gammaproteobacteria bacterium RIFCSPHIGHO2_02_FULL_42_43]OGT52592.1 MAG: hypothetical protein A3E54_06415 [Gammaproteobacteria bacterium RIFCSPHIGHO2_12_FULL_41_25]OGT63190.1 MAG: hypothetical protein A3I77_06220 [Gammaproteobacteria bacterium RIFCSPLOWO2_02_FULL_42_14]OGT86691.1 MAG: hypothetical protein A3G86_05045 [Gammaproteobacteria bacterium RIFCSPLOWO2_12_FULL_42_18]